MKKTLQLWSALILFLFLFPVLIQLKPGGMPVKSTKLLKEPTFLVYASNVTEEETEKGNGKALLYFTHSHEAYEPVTKAVEGKVAVSHQSENIMKIGEKLKKQLDFNGVETDILPIDNAKEMSRSGIPHHRAYAAIRPHVKKRIGEQEYELVIDMHRDSVGPSKTTLTHEGEKYAKVAFVIGMEHPNYAQNRARAKQLKEGMEQLVPGITRDFIMKGGSGVDGKYNQDLHPGVVLIEVGGIGNAEDELNRTVSVIAKSAATMLAKSERVEY